MHEAVEQNVCHDDERLAEVGGHEIVAYYDE